MKGNKNGRVIKHRGNPHGNAPNPKQSSRGKLNNDDSLREEGVSRSKRDKQ